MSKIEFVTVDDWSLRISLAYETGQHRNLAFQL